MPPATNRLSPQLITWLPRRARTRCPPTSKPLLTHRSSRRALNARSSRASSLSPLLPTLSGVLNDSVPVVSVAAKSRIQVPRAMKVMSSGIFSNSSWVPLR
ncbi:Uncharacterised protein [Acinetobacter baumannii]|nr:Uncharacterised protein [Acinetobacter baumannii]